MISCAKSSARRAALRLTAAVCLLTVACVGEVNTGKPNGEDDSDATAPTDGGDAGRDAGRTSDAKIEAGMAGPTTDAGATDARPSGSDTGVAGPDAGSEDGPNPPTDAQVATDTGSPSGRTQPVFVAVGYKGLRMVSRDLGLTWTNQVTSGGGGDDEHLLRGVAYGKDLFVAVGWKIWTSPDAVTWTERDNPAGQWYGAVKFGRELFVAAGGVGTSVYSSDGLSWMAGLDRQGQAARSVAFGDNTFVAAVDQNRWWQTTNGREWAVHSDGHGSSAVVWCRDHFSDAADCAGPEGRNGGRVAFGAGVYVSVAGSKIERSTDGSSWQTVQNPAQTDLTDVAFGYVAP